ncbi:MAG TPA: hypothetical protein VLB44_02185, partial [Kofleriaceae bacterium]|nr:hypothetical protein [Kofleriaceae bacterium]
MIDKLHRDDQAKELRPAPELNKPGAKDPQSDHEDKQAGDRLAKVSVNNAVGKPPSAKDNAEVMEMFREVNGDPAPATAGAKPATNATANAKAGVGKPPSAADSAGVMNDFREVNGDVGRGKPPSAKDNAEVMEMFREVNGDPAP